MVHKYGAPTTPVSLVNCFSSATCTDRKENQTLIDQIKDLTSSHDALLQERESLRIENEHKDELLCFSDRISSRLFDMIHNIRTQVEAAESLSPAIRSLSTTPTSPSSCSEAASSTSAQTETTALTDLSPVPLEELIKEIEAKYSD